jgi:hypothetical protein
MSFFGIGKSKKNQNSSLPAATRDITSAHGSDPRSNTANGLNGSRQGIERSGALPPNQSAGASANPSLESMRASDMAGPEPGKVLRQRAESDLTVST